MILVDTSVWIDFFRNKRTHKTSQLEAAIADRVDLCTCGIVVTELLQGVHQDQGVRQDSVYQAVKENLLHLIYLNISRPMYESAADIYRLGRKKGVTIRSTVDCIIASCAITNSLLVLEQDRDFRLIARFTELKLLS